MKILKKLIPIIVILAIITVIFFPKRLFDKEDFVQFDLIEYEGEVIYIQDSDNATPTNIDAPKVLDALLECRKQPQIDYRILFKKNTYSIILSLKNNNYINIILSDNGDFLYTDSKFSHRRLTNTEKLREVLSEYK